MAARMTKRADGRYQASLRYEDLTTGKSKRSYFYGKTQKEANQKRDEAKKRLDVGKPVTDSAARLGEWMETWRTLLLPSSNLAPATQKLYIGLSTTWIEPALGDIALSKIRPIHVNQVLMNMQVAGRKASSRRSAYFALNHALNAAVKNKLLAENPVSQVEAPDINDQDESRALTVEEVVAFFKAATEPNKYRGGSGLRYVTALRVTVGTGLRRGETLGLRWDKIDFDKREAEIVSQVTPYYDEEKRIIIQPYTKGKKGSRRPFVVALSAPVIEILKKRKVEQAAEKLRAGDTWEEHGLVFTTEIGQPVHPRNLLRTVEIAAKKANLGKIGVHTLRHTYATAGMQLGKVSPTVMQKMLDHGSVTTTMLYSHTVDPATREATEIIASILPFTEEDAI